MNTEIGGIVGRVSRVLRIIVTAGPILLLILAVLLSHNPVKAGATGSIDITGTVTNPSGAGVGGVSVYATDPGSSTVDYGPVTSASDGSYDLSLSVAGTYDFHFDPPAGSGLQSVVDNNITVLSSQTINVQFTPITHIFSGSFTDAFGNSLENFDHLSASNANGSTNFDTDSNGHFSINLTPGQYGVDVTDPCNGCSYNPDGASLMLTSTSTPIDLTSGDVSHDLVLPTIHLNIAVKDADGNPISGATVTAYSDGGTVNLGSGGSSIPEAIQFFRSDGATNSDGTVSLVSLNGASYSQSSGPLNQTGNICAQIPNSQTVCIPAPTELTQDTNLLLQELPAIPSAPTNLSAESPTAAPELSWDAVPTADSYNIYRDGAKIDSSSTNSYTDNNVLVGNHTYYVTAVNGGGESSPSNSINVVVGTAPSITSTDSTSTGMNVPFSFNVTTSGNPAPAITESGALPSGITFTDNADGTAQLSGTAAVGTVGTYPITITDDNGIGSPDVQAFTLTVTSATSAPVITSAASDTEAYGTSFSFTVTTTGYPIPTISKIGGLPAGVTFTKNGDGTATIAGTPSGSAAGVYNLTIKAHNLAGTATQSFTLTINRSPTLKGINNKTTSVGKAFSQVISSIAYPTATITEDGSLPDGLSFVDNGDGTASISGTPSVGSAGTYPITITASNGSGNDAQNFILTVVN